MTPPELAREAPVLNVLEPLAVDAAPFGREDVDFARSHGFKTHFSDRFVGVERPFGSGLAHRHIPLLGEHRLDDFARARDARDHVLDFLDANQEPRSLQILNGGLAAFVAVHAAVLLGHVLVHARRLREDVEHREIVAAADFKVVEVVGRRDLHAARTKFAVDVRVGNDGNFAVREGELKHLADERLVALVLRMNSNGLVAEERFRTGRRNDDAFGVVSARIADFPEMADRLLAFHFKVGDRALQLRVPVDEALAAVNEAFFIEAHEGFNDDLRELRIHREVEAVPVDAVAHAAHLLENRAARELLPLPDLRDEVLALHFAALEALLFELTLNDNLRGDAGVVRAREPHCVVARHAVVARERVHHRLVEGVAHVQDAGDVGRGKLNGEGGLLGVKAGAEVAALFPNGIPAGFNCVGFKALGELLGLLFRHGLCV